MCIRYKHRPVRTTVQPGGGAASPSVTLVVQVHRASGLQAAARYLISTVLLEVVPYDFTWKRVIVFFSLTFSNTLLLLITVM